MLQPKPVAVAVALAALALSGDAAALTVTQSLQGTIIVNAGDPPEAQDFTTSGNVYGDAYTGGRYGQRSSFNGDLPTGSTNIRVLAGRSYQTESSLVYSALVKNDSATDIDLTFSFFIGRGRAAVLNEYETAAYDAYAGLSGEIIWGDTNLWSVDLDVYSSGAVVDGALQRTTDHAFSRTGAAGDFEISGSGAEYFYSPYAKTLGLGSLAAGEERLLTYTLSGIGEYVGGSDGDSYGYGGQAVVGAYDPFDFDGRPVDEFGNPLPGGLQAPVPEPGTYAMLGIGLATLFGVVRSRRRRSAQ